MKGQKERATLNIAKNTKAALDLVKHLGQSYDGIIYELVQHYKGCQMKGRRQKYNKQ